MRTDRKRTLCEIGVIAAAVALLMFALVRQYNERWGPVPEHPVPLGARVVQWSDKSCGPAAVATLLNVYGRSWSPDSLEQETAIAEGGASMLGLICAFQSHGLKARGLKTGRDGIRRVPRPFIAYLQPESGRLSGHFVVVETLRGTYFQVFDPTTGGEREWSCDELMSRGQGNVLSVSE